MFTEKKFLGSDFGQIIEEEKEEQKNNDEFNNRSHIHKRFQMGVILESENNQVNSDSEQQRNKDQD